MSNKLLSRSLAYLQQDKNNTNTFIRYTFRFFRSFAESYRKFLRLSVKISIEYNKTLGPTGMETDNHFNNHTLHMATEPIVRLHKTNHSFSTRQWRQMSQQMNNVGSDLRQNQAKLSKNSIQKQSQHKAHDSTWNRAFLTLHAGTASQSTHPEITHEEDQTGFGNRPARKGSRLWSYTQCRFPGTHVSRREIGLGSKDRKDSKCCIDPTRRYPVLLVTRGQLARIQHQIDPTRSVAFPSYTFDSVKWY